MSFDPNDERLSGLVNIPTNLPADQITHALKEHCDGMGNISTSLENDYAIIYEQGRQDEAYESEYLYFPDKHEFQEDMDDEPTEDNISKAIDGIGYTINAITGLMYISVLVKYRLIPFVKTKYTKLRQTKK